MKVLLGLHVKFAFVLRDVKENPHVSANRGKKFRL
jgi:hypothetical protein